MAAEVSWLQSLQERAFSEVETQFYAQTAAAEAARPAETKACVKLQSTWRGRTTRMLIAYWAEHALVCERVSRGHLGRQVARRHRIARDLLRQRAFFDAFATAIQQRSAATTAGSTSTTFTRGRRTSPRWCRRATRCARGCSSDWSSRCVSPPRIRSFRSSSLFRAPFCPSPLLLFSHA